MGQSGAVATEEGIERWDMSSNSWDSAWVPGSGFANNAEDEVDNCSPMVLVVGRYKERVVGGFQILRS